MWIIVNIECSLRHARCLFGQIARQRRVRWCSKVLLGGADSVVVNNALAFRRLCLLVVQFASIESMDLVYNLSLENI